ncbi:MAG: hypothetical protein K2Y56_13935 [Methylobacterium sp.]|uniref:hypothetical protein n=1 Tax=Methylobacterium sp. TaxID=409 RepID=UPI0025D8D715|nr:hypothetical protein [Methylobacterium sp.]MBX9932618.1 hypothetical protein [Methylobacterium sp.]
MKEIRFDFVDPGKANTGRGIELFGQPAAEWTEQDIQVAIAAFRRCEEQLFRANLDPTGQPQNRRAVMKDYEVLITRGAARIEESLREIILVDRRKSSGSTASASSQSGPETASAERRSRDPGQRPNPDEAFNLGLAASPEGPDLRISREAEVKLALLQDARRIATDRERENLRAGMPPSERRIAQGASVSDRSGEVAAYVPRPIVSSFNCALTRDGFEQIQRGMLLERVEAVIGCRGSLTATSTAADLGKIEVHLWDDRRTSGTITVQFLNNVVFTKSQVGLN